MYNNTQPQVNFEKYPSITQNHRHFAKTSEKYSFIPTFEAIEAIQSIDLVPIAVSEQNSRKHHGFGLHEIRFREPQNTGRLQPGDTVLELVLRNSHMGTSAFRLSLGMFRCICANQMCVPDGTVKQHSIRHIGFTRFAVQDAVQDIIEHGPKAIETMKSWQSIELDRNERLALADAAIPLRFDGDKWAVEPSEILTTRRYADRDDTSLWTTFNVIQENLVKGGLRHRTRANKHRASREVKAIGARKALNESLWILAEKMAELKA